MTHGPHRDHQAGHLVEGDVMVQGKDSGHGRYPEVAHAHAQWKQKYQRRREVKAHSAAPAEDKGGRCGGGGGGGS